MRVANDVVTRGYRVPSHEFDVEAQLVYPLLKGARQIRGWRVEPGQLAVVVPNSSIRGRLDVEEVRQRYPRATEHFEWIERETGGGLTRRSTYGLRMASRLPFFFVYNVGDYTFAPFKVVWAEIASSLCAAIAGSRPLVPGGEPRPFVPDHKVYFAPFEDELAAGYVCGFLSAPAVRAAVNAFTAKLQVGTLLQHIRIPPFDGENPAHLSLARLAASNGSGEAAGAELDVLVRDALMRQR